ncbi:2-succinyl-6-hydroxy-2,4-cyclohexadiene-1-carboxylate synthase [Cytobacillus eiseniae]|uniref:Putative 2-succinyl-6-hydroxy-2,4-cyclohexadiene-1-carboxylate synthase n=1 Tax=Cytobacillus eiseniae TaxID=762947 RepID=A0ABS4RJG5_9BACI|nr:2-succinyl-6-hydroxy-2,4-cyclohexadiene-1-carboxylate synthase [Cytobacillus eiseniae]MBP2243027.1 2-succinyl-6-hydroxy-2,4-cyclohexadiene-1-carboxylate synthase [Cytobacillus eiseniae]
MKYRVDGINYYVDSWGNKEAFPFLLLHGFTGSATSWRKLKPDWEQTLNVFALDIIGHGQSDSPIGVGRYEIEAAANDIAELMDQIGIEQIDLLGYSMGGRLALTFAIKFPKKVRKLILESSSPGLRTAEEQEIRRLQDLKLATTIKDHGLAHFVDYWENIPLFQSQKRLPVAIREEIRNERMKNSQDGLFYSLKGMGTGAQPSWWDELDALNTPTLLITGSLDKKFCTIAEQMQESIKFSSVKTVFDCGHAIHVEKPKIFGTIVNEFLSNEKRKTF